MQRSSWSGALRIWALLALLAGLLVAPAHTGLAQSVAGQTDTAAAHSPSAPSATAVHVVALDSAGKIKAYGLNNNALVLLWESSGAGWGNVALGDFDGDGVKEIVATSIHQSGVQDKIAIFDPLTGSAPVATGVLAQSNYAMHLLVTGNFEGSPRDQIAYTYMYTDGSGFHEVIQEAWLSGTQVLSRYIWDYGAIMAAATAGDVNRDGLADLVLVRNIDHFIHIWAGQNGSWSNLSQTAGYATNWTAAAIGPVVNSSSYPGNQLVLARDWGGYQNYHTELMFWWGAINYLVDLTPATVPSPYSHNPEFTDLALGNLNGNPAGFRQIIGMRDPTTAGVADLVVIDPVGYNMPAFQPSGDYGLYAWKHVAAGDLDADGKDEIIVLRDGPGSAIRVYDQPDVDTHYLADTTTPGGFMASALAVGDLGLASGCGMPKLAAAPTSVNLTVQYGQVASTPVQVLNSGSGGSISWTASITAGGSWFQISPASGGTPGSFSITVNGTTAGVGTHTGGNVRITGLDPCGGTQTVDVSVAATVPDPGFIAYPPYLSFYLPPNGTGTFQGTIHVARPGSTTPVTWQAFTVPVTAASSLVAALADGSAQVTNAGIVGPNIPNAPAWLTVSPQSGDTINNPDITVMVNVTGPLPAAHNYAAVVLVPTNPFNPAWVRTVVVAVHQGNNIFLPFLAR